MMRLTNGAIVLALATLFVVGALAAQDEEPQPVAEDEDGTVSELEERYEEHTVVTGDTLWDLAGEYYGDPWKWPDIWELNAFVTDPHWIYPDQVLKIRITSETVRRTPEVLPGQPVPVEQPIPSSLPALASLPERDMTFRVRLKSNLIDFISPRKLSTAGEFIESYNEVYMLSDQDTAYFKYEGDAPITIGDQFTLFRHDHKVKHPARWGKVGWLVDTVGELEVIDIGEDRKGRPVYTGRIVDATADINLDDRLLPLESRPVNITVNPATRDVQGYIIEATEGLLAIGEGHIVFLDVGSDDGVQVGNTFQIYREAYNKKKAPPYYVGNLIVIKTMAETATALVTFSRKDLRAGDMVVSEVLE